MGAKFFVPKMGPKIKRVLNPNQNNWGQSALEFLLIFPAVIGLYSVMIKVNSAIQTSIVNQKYVRAQTLYLAFNSPWYPEIFKPTLSTELAGAEKAPIRKAGINSSQNPSNAMMLGMSALPIMAEDTDIGPQGKVYTIVQTVARTKEMARSLASGSTSFSEEVADGEKRNRVPVRTSDVLCTPTYIDQSGNPIRLGEVMAKNLSQYYKFCTNYFAESGYNL